MYYDDDDEDVFFSLFLSLFRLFLSPPFLSAFGCQKQFLFFVFTFSFLSRVKSSSKNCNNNNNNNDKRRRRRRDDFQLGRVDGVLPVRVFVSGTRFDTRHKRALSLYLCVRSLALSPLSVSSHSRAIFHRVTERTQLFLRRNNTNT